MSPIRKLAGQTAIYGLSSIIGRFLNYLLVPLHTARFVAEQYGIITEMYAYVAFLVVLLAYGLETAYFRYASREDHDRNAVYSTSLFSLLSTSFIFILLSVIFRLPVAEWLQYPNHTEYVVWFAIIVGLDAIATIPLARLREENKAKRFAWVNLANVFVNIGLNVFFIGYLMPQYLQGESNWWVETFYDHDIGVGYVFIANLIASIVKFSLLIPTMLRAGWNFSVTVWKTLLRYSLPLLVAGLAGIINETLDRIMLKRILFDQVGKQAALTQVGIYGACYKVSIIITLFIQAFRYAAEPFFFAQEKEKDPKQIYARVMTYFVIVCAAIFLGVLLYLDIIKHFLQNEQYWQGLTVVPILLFANICLGIFYNLSVWYKLTEKTRFGAYISVMGAVITIILNYLLIPKLGYVGSAWATLACYASMAIVSFLIGRRYYRIPYDLRKVALYLGGALLLYFISRWLPLQEQWLEYTVHTILFLLFITLAWRIERPGLLSLKP